MKNFRFHLFAFLFLTLTFFTACDDDNDQPKGEFENGIFVVNEGNFQDANGTVSHINTSGEVTNDLFGAVNDGLALGDVVQSMSVNGDLGYVVVNNSNKVEVVNVNTFEADYTISDLALPRYFTTFNGKGYVTEWVSFSDPGRVSVIDLETHAVTGSITTDFGAENIIEKGGKLYVSNSFTTTVSVIDPALGEVVSTIEVGNGPGGFVIDQQNQLWVICGGGLDSNFDPLNDGKLVQINPSTNQVVKSIELGTNVTAKMAINKTGNILFYFKGKSVYGVSTTASSVNASDDLLLTESSATHFYGIGVDPETDILYVADDKAFAGNGTVFTYTSSGTSVGVYTVGIGPNGFAFR